MSRGVTLVEILIVLAIVGLLAGGIAIYAVPKFEQARVQSTKNNLKSLHAASELWRADHPGECPDVAKMKADKTLVLSSDSNDAWGTPYRIQCDDESTTFVLSLGPDHKEGTPDDLKFPEPPKQ